MNPSQVCPNCGDWVEYLLNETGWCESCSLEELGGTRCITCGGFYSKRNHHVECWQCRREAWLFKHADRIEHYMAQGSSYYQATLSVADDIRPHCRSCNKVIPRARATALFCKGCESASRQYLSLKKQGLDPDVALEITLGNVTILST